MLRLCSRYPGGRIGVGLLLLRIMVALSVLIQAAGHWVRDGGHSGGGFALVVVSIVASGAILVGFLTPLLSAMITLQSLATAFGWFAAPEAGMFSLLFPPVTTAVVAAVTVLLGPGAFSIDAHLFGMREIVIPRRDDTTGS